MTMTVEEILAQVQDLSPDEQARLRAALVPADEHGATAYPPIAADVQRMLAGHTANDFTVPPQGTAEDARALLRSWNANAANELDDGDESWDNVLRALDAHRYSSRVLFPELARTQ